MCLMPTHLLRIRRAGIRFGDHLVQSSVYWGHRVLATSINRRRLTGISTIVISTLSFVSTPGVLVTVMLCFVAALTSILSVPLPKLAISFRFWPVRAISPTSIIGNCRHRNVRLPDSCHRLFLPYGPVFSKACIKKFRHACFNRIGRFPD